MFAPEINDFVYITDNAYTEDAIKQMEIKILQTLKFNLFEPLSLHFLRRFSKAGDVDVLQHSLAKFAIELALVEYDLVPIPGSKLAASALCLSLMLLEPQVLVKESCWSYLYYRRSKTASGEKPWCSTAAITRRS